MKTRYVLSIAFIFMPLFIYPLEAQESLIFSRPKSTRPGHGLISERIMKEAYSRIGINNIEFLYLPTERALVAANDGKTDGELARIAGIERKYPNLVGIPVPLRYLEVVVYTKKVEFAVEGWHSLAPYLIGIPRGFKVAEFNTKNMNVEVVNSAELAFRKLDAGRNDIVVELRSAQCGLDKLGVSGIKILEPPLVRTPMYHYLHKRNAALAAKLEKVLTQMDQDGVIERIRERAVQDIYELCQ